MAGHNGRRPPARQVSRAPVDEALGDPEPEAPAVMDYQFRPPAIRHYQGETFEPTGQTLMLRNTDGTQGFSFAPQYRQVIPAGFPYWQIGKALLAGLVVLGMLIGYVMLWSAITGGMIHVTIAYPHGGGGHLIPTPAPLRTPPPGGG